MTLSQNRRWLAVVVFFLAASAGAKPKVLPVVNASLFGGASTLNHQDTGFKGTVRLEVLPVVELNKRHALLPTFRLAYLGSQSAAKIIDGKSLLQSQQNYQAELAWIHRFRPDWKMVTTLGGDWNFLKETKDENWGGGLYDHRDAYASYALERRFRGGKRPGFLRGGAEVTLTRYPNYESLAALAGQALAGRRTLDTNSMQLFGNSENALTQHLYIQGRLALTVDFYPDQKQIQADGPSNNEKRRDSTAIAGARVIYSLPAWESRSRSLETTVGLGLNLRARDSNQNEVGPVDLKFVRNYYDYREGQAEPFVEWRLHPADWVATLGASRTRRQYDHRPVQDAAGAFLSSDFVTTETAVFARWSLPLWRNLRAVASAERLWAHSNTDYQVYYRYNYTTTSYLAGVTYEF